MFLAVWMLYAADRILDASTSSPAELEARHYFHHRHRASFLTGILLVSVALATLLPRLEASVIHLYLILGGLLAGYFILIHATPTVTSKTIAHRFPKEIAVGIFFAAATFIPTVAHRPDLRITLLPPGLLFATLCSLNCLFIYTWEHTGPHPGHPAHAATRFALRHLCAIAIIIPILAILLCLTHNQRPIPIACALSSLLLLLLHHQRHKIAPVTLRAAADLALMTPILVLPFLQ